MKIVVLGAGAMGSLFGGYLSSHNDVWLVDVSKTTVDAINANGVKVKEKDGSENVFHPKACIDSSKAGIGKADLVITFVKSMFTVAALGNNSCVIGPDTFIMTLQNGAGHESKLLKFADKNHVIIGSTQHNSSVLGPGHVFHGGVGHTDIGLLDGVDSKESTAMLVAIARTFTDYRLECGISDNVQWQIWHKLFTNTAASSLTAIYQVPLGFIASNAEANRRMRVLVGEAVAVANALGLDFDREKVAAEVQAVCENAKDGFTSIYADIRAGRKTEVDTISGSVVEAAHQLGIAVPCHEWVVETIHDMEKKNMKGGSVNV